MDKKELDIQAIELVIKGKIKEQILGIFGDENEDTCIAKMHAMLEVAETLKIKTLDVTITLEDLQKARKLYIKTQLLEDEDVD